MAKLREDGIKPLGLRSPWHSITEIVKIIEAFENPSWIGQLRERWKEIKKASRLITEPANQLRH